MKKKCFKECYERIGSRISDERKKLDMTQEQFARSIGGISASTISKIERGEDLSGNFLDRIQHICEVLGIEDFFDKELEKARIRSYKEALRRDIRNKYYQMNYLQNEINECEKRLESL